MMGKTHKAGGALAALIAFKVLGSKGLLDEHINSVVQLVIMYPFCMWGSIAPDLDQSKDAIPEKTPISLLVNKVLHIGKIHHRSWQTHSILVNGVLVALMFFGVHLLNANSLLDAVSTSILNLMITGLTVGVASHIVLDVFTYEGVPLAPPVKKDGKRRIMWVRLVPRLDIFKTNTRYETCVRVLLYMATVLMLLYTVLKDTAVLQNINL